MIENLISPPSLMIRSTNKINRKVHGYLNEFIDCENPFLDWHIHLFTANRVQYLIYTNTNSLLSFISYGKGITDDSALIKDVLYTIREGLTKLSLDFFYNRHISKATGSAIFTKTNSRSVLGSINDFVKIARWLIENRDHNPFSVSKELNQMPMKAIGHASPLSAFENMQ